MDNLLEAEHLVQDESFINYCLYGIDKERWDAIGLASTINHANISKARKLVIAMYDFGLNASIQENEQKLREVLQVNSNLKIEKHSQKVANIWIKWVAASVIVIGSFLLVFKFEKNKLPVNYELVKTLSGEQKKIVFPDSSVVWMDGNTVLKYVKGDFFDRHIILLEGQIACLVKHDDRQKFVINTHTGLEIEDIGTLFSIYSKKGIDREFVNVLEGEVKVSYHRKSSNLRENTSYSISHRTEKQELGICDVNQLAWRDGFYIYKNITLEEFIVNLQDVFNIKIFMRNKKYDDLIVSSSFHNTDNVVDIFQALQSVYGLHFKQNNPSSYSLF